MVSILEAQTQYVIAECVKISPSLTFISFSRSNSDSSPNDPFLSSLWREMRRKQMRKSQANRYVVAIDKVELRTGKHWEGSRGEDDTEVRKQM